MIWVQGKCKQHQKNREQKEMKICQNFRYGTFIQSSVKPRNERTEQDKDYRWQEELTATINISTINSKWRIVNKTLKFTYNWWPQRTVAFVWSVFCDVRLDESPSATPQIAQRNRSSCSWSSILRIENLLIVSISSESLVLLLLALLGWRLCVVCSVFYHPVRSTYIALHAANQITLLVRNFTEL